MVPDVMEISGTDAVLAARLCNFATGRADLLDAHIQWLMSKVRQYALDPNAWVDIVGFASRRWNDTGGLSSADLNQQLSYQRCGKVRDKIAANVPLADFHLKIARGDQDSVMPDPNEGYERAVEVYIYAARTKPAPRPAPEPKPVISAQQFTIRLDEIASPGLSVAQADIAYFEIVDVTRSMKASFVYRGIGFAANLPIPKFPKIQLPASWSFGRTEPTPFRTARHTELYWFNRQAEFYQDPSTGGVGPVSLGGGGHLAIKDLYDSKGYIAIHPRVIPIEIGMGISMPSLFSATKGVLILNSAVTPYSPNQ